jgi:predicted TIM-barrel fold metal-dependent hydrolase
MRHDSITALLQLAELPSVHIKVSALFRICPSLDFTSSPTLGSATVAAAAAVDGSATVAAAATVDGEGNGNSGAGGADAAAAVEEKAGTGNGAGEGAGEGAGDEDTVSAAVATRVLMAYGSRRLLFGSDFPYVVLDSNGGYGRSIEAVRQWVGVAAAAAGEDGDAALENVMGGTARRLFFGD